jgi:hypothetical protein
MMEGDAVGNEEKTIGNEERRKESPMDGNLLNASKTSITNGPTVHLHIVQGRYVRN